MVVIAGLDLVQTTRSSATNSERGSYNYTIFVETNE